MKMENKTENGIQTLKTWQRWISEMMGVRGDITLSVSPRRVIAQMREKQVGDVRTTGESGKGREGAFIRWEGIASIRQVTKQRTLGVERAAGWRVTDPGKRKRGDGFVSWVVGVARKTVVGGHRWHIVLPSLLLTLDGVGGSLVSMSSHFKETLAVKKSDYQGNFSHMGGAHAAIDGLQAIQKWQN